MRKIADGKLASLDAKVRQVLFPFNLLTREGEGRRMGGWGGEVVKGGGGRGMLSFVLKLFTATVFKASLGSKRQETTRIGDHLTRGSSTKSNTWKETLTYGRGWEERTQQKPNKKMIKKTGRRADVRGSERTRKEEVMLHVLVLTITRSFVVDLALLEWYTRHGIFEHWNETVVNISPDRLAAFIEQLKRLSLTNVSSFP